MFEVKYVVVKNHVKNFFECNMPNGITHDFLLLSKYSICLKTEDLPLQRYASDTAFFFPKGTPYYYSPCPNEPYTDYFIHFICDRSFYTEFRIPAARPIHLCDPERIYNLIEMIAFENFLTGPNQHEILNHLMKTLFIKVSESTTIGETIPYYNELLKIRRDIFNHPEKKWTLEQISESLHMSSGYVHSMYKKAFKTTCMQDVIESRIQYSKHALTYTEQPINLIAVNSGYNNLEHFCRQFKKCTGLRPSQYRDAKKPHAPQQS